MSSRGGIRLIQDQNPNLDFTGSVSGWGNVNGLKVQKKGAVGGRKPLGDLSNAGKRPSPNEALKKQSSKSFSVIEEETVSNSFKIKGNANRKRSTSKTADKAQSAGRKALADISNSKKLSNIEKPRTPKALKENASTKLGVLAEESVFTDAIAEEQFLHKHEECNKMQDHAVDKDCFLKILGLDKGPSQQSAFPWVSPVSSKLTIENSRSYCFQYEEMAEMPTVDGSTPKREVSSSLDSPNPCQTPSPDQYSHWKDQEFVDFALMDSPM